MPSDPRPTAPERHPASPLFAGARIFPSPLTWQQKVTSIANAPLFHSFQLRPKVLGLHLRLLAREQGGGGDPSVFRLCPFELRGV